MQFGKLRRIIPQTIDNDVVHVRSGFFQTTVYGQKLAVQNWSAPLFGNRSLRGVLLLSG